MALVAASILTAGTSAPIDHPRWAVRVSYDGVNRLLDQPNCHALAYFLSDTAQLNYHHGVIHIQPGKTKDEAAHQTIGEVAGWKILQVTHKIDDGALYLRLLLVERHAGEFCEIYHQEYIGVPDEPADLYGVYDKVLPAYLVNVGSETVLGVNDPVSGNGNWSDEHYWSFDRDGPIDLSISEKIRDIENRLLPKGYGVMKGGGFNIEELSYSSPVWGPKDAVCCASSGTIQIQFALKNHRLTVVSQSFSPN
jgi:hypothetical protein